VLFAKTTNQENSGSVFIRMKTMELAKLEKATQMLIEAKSLDEVKHIIDIAEAAKTYAKAAKLGLDAQNHAAEIAILARRKAGEFLAQLERDQGFRTDLTSSNVGKSSDYKETIQESGISYQDANRWQQVAAVPEETFKEFIERTKTDGKELTTYGVIKIARQLQREEYIEKQTEEIQSNKFLPPSGTFDVIVIDPPWQYGTKYDPNGRRAANPYPEMSLEEIAKINLPASNDCILWLWTTHKFMRHSFDLLDQWGFRDVAIVTWVKDRMGLGSWLRSQSEFCIMAVKGSPKVNLTNQTTIINGALREHSRKPDEFYQFVDSLCIGYKLDYFSREKRDGWVVFGNDTEKF
jgi:N6-adenosine-specific RNA methylase IME4